jgi:hypothetical protein
MEAHGLTLEKRPEEVTKTFTILMELLEARGIDVSGAALCDATNDARVHRQVSPARFKSTASLRRRSIFHCPVTNAPERLARRAAHPTSLMYHPLTDPPTSAPMAGIEASARRLVMLIPSCLARFLMAMNAP